MLKFKKIEAGLYRAEHEGDTYEVERDKTGYVTIEQREGDGLLAGCDDDGWSLAINDNVIDWFDTKRDAVAYAEAYAERLRKTGCEKCAKVKW